MSDEVSGAAVEAAASVLRDNKTFRPCDSGCQCEDDVADSRAVAEDMLIAAFPYLRGLVEKLQALCDDEWLRRRDRIMRLPGARYMRDNGAGEIEIAAHQVRRLIDGLPGYDPIGSGGTYVAWMRNGRDGAEVPR